MNNFISTYGVCTVMVYRDLKYNDMFYKGQKKTGITHKQLWLCSKVKVVFDAPDMSQY